MSERQIEITVRQPGHSERRVMIGVGETHIGRAEDNDIVLTDIGVSRRHARILVQPNGLWIEDMGSGNGTHYRGHRVRRQALKEGDEVLIDPFILHFLIRDPVTQDDGVTAELEEVSDDDTVRLGGPATDPAILQGVGGVCRGRLTTLAGQRLAPSYAVHEQALTLGRSEIRDVILFDPAASRDHAVVERVGTDFWVRDQGSANGTYVNSIRIKEQCLRNGDRVRIGVTEFNFELMDPVNAPPVDVPTLPPPRSMRAERPPVDTLASAPHEPDAPGLISEPVAPPSESITVARQNHGLRVVLLASVGGFAVMAMMIVGGLLALYLLEPDLRLGGEEKSVGQQSYSSGDVAQSDAAPSVSTETRLNSERLLAQGQDLFDKGDYLEATAQFYSVLKSDPANPRAERMGFIACEYLLIDTLRHGLTLRNLPDEEKASRRRRAMRLGRRSLRLPQGSPEDSPRASVHAEAIEALRSVQIFLPEDAQVADLLTRVSKRAG